MKENLPNIISTLRILAAPGLLCAAWMGYGRVFLVLLLCSLISDVLDGYLARKLNACTELGAKLDTWGDMATYLSVPLCAWWLIPELVKQEAIFLSIVMASYVIPILVSLLKFKETACYHTWSAKGAAVIMSTSVFLIFMLEIIWPFRVAAVVQVVVAFEGVLITIQLPELRSNIKSYWHLLHERTT